MLVLLEVWTLKIACFSMSSSIVFPVSDRALVWVSSGQIGAFIGVGFDHSCSLVSFVCFMFIYFYFPLFMLIFELGPVCIKVPTFSGCF